MHFTHHCWRIFFKQWKWHNLITFQIQVLAGGCTQLEMSTRYSKPRYSRENCIIEMSMKEKDVTACHWEGQYPSVRYPILKKLEAPSQLTVFHSVDPKERDSDLVPFYGQAHVFVMFVCVLPLLILYALFLWRGEGRGREGAEPSMKT